MGPRWELCASAFVSEERYLLAGLRYRDCSKAEEPVVVWSGENFYLNS